MAFGAELYGALGDDPNDHAARAAYDLASLRFYAGSVCAPPVGGQRTSGSFARGSARRRGPVRSLSGPQ
ncbi:hypothetical protein CG740_33520 [Streptomyces sp. CB01201]|nr:hypothetical protein CG740_33520 [Streptomyces sp. CB01201]